MNDKNFSALSEASAIIEFDAKGIVKNISEKFQQMVGYSASEIIGRHHSILVLPAEHSSIEYYRFWENLRSGLSQSGEYRRLRKNQNEIWLQSVYTPIFDQEGNVTEVILISQDITEKKTLSLSIEQQMMAINRSNNVIEFDPNGFIMWANDNFLKLMGYNLDEIVGKHHSLFVDATEKDSGYYKAFWQRLSSGEFLAGEFKRVAKDGHSVWIQGSYNPVFNRVGKVYKVTKFALDLSELKKYEQSLKESLKKAEAATRAKSMFLANMSHEIRTPMNSILGLTETLLDDQSLVGEHRKHVEVINRSNKHLLSIVNEILDFFKIEHGDVKIAKSLFDLRHLVQEVVELHEFRAKAKGISVSWSIDSDVKTAVHSDQKRLRQILTNLLSNALKFTDSGSISVVVKDLPPKHLSFLVSDSGIGIPNDKLPLVFNAFYQVEEDSTRAFGGTGLGLSIVKNLVHLLGGEVTVRSQLGKGSTFEFSILNEMQASVDRIFLNGEDLIEEIQNYRFDNFTSDRPLDLMIADDSEDNRNLLKVYFSKAPFNITFAANGQEAIDICQEKKFDLILMDIQMPVVDGMDAAETIRKGSGVNKDTIIFATTASAYLDHFERCKNIGFDCYISKPIKKDLLLGAAIKVLSTHHLLQLRPPAMAS